MSEISHYFIATSLPCLGLTLIVNVIFDLMTKGVSSEQGLDGFRVWGG